ncbi:hypothetical protein BDD12DRAFT_916256 [Trichophaea hybrida]|nr:hypothetical protein BDD12DRAFT_916256 [Trichophaea hybrida]
MGRRRWWLAKMGLAGVPGEPISTEPYSNRPTFLKLNRDVKADVVIVGGGIAEISVAYEAVKKGLSVALIEARDTLSGETGRTSSHLASELDDRFYELIKGYVIVEVPDTDPQYSKKNDLPDEVEALKKLGIKHNYENKGKIGEAYTGAILEFPHQATFHPTKYLNGILKVLKEKHSNQFQAYTHTRMKSYKDLDDAVIATIEGGNTVEGRHMLMATNVPLPEIIIKDAYYRTYCIAMRAPKGAYKDVLLYDNGDPYVYVRKTAHPDPKYEYLVVGGEDHKVRQETSEGYGKHYQHLEAGQIVKPNDYMAFIGQNTGFDKNVYVSTGDSGNELTHGVIVGRLITDLMIGVQNPWASLYSPSRKPKPRTILEEISENVNQNLQFAKYIKTDVSNIESIPRKLGKPIAVYKDGEGNISKFSAICPHMKGVVAWNASEMSWDCPVHGSRFGGLTGKCVMGPAIRSLATKGEAVEKA